MQVTNLANCTTNSRDLSGIEGIGIARLDLARFDVSRRLRFDTRFSRLPLNIHGLIETFVLSLGTGFTDWLSVGRRFDPPKLIEG